MFNVLQSRAGLEYIYMYALHLYPMYVTLEDTIFKSDDFESPSSDNDFAEVPTK